MVIEFGIVVDGSFQLYQIGEPRQIAQLLLQRAFLPQPLRQGELEHRIYGHAAGAQFTGLISLLALISHQFEHQARLFSQLIFRLAAAKLPLLVVQADLPLLLEPQQQPLYDRQGDAQPGGQLGGTQRLLRQGGQQLGAAIHEPGGVQ
ncbi:hypothetical protein D3C80_1586920 [compost metagenome]